MIPEQVEIVSRTMERIKPQIQIFTETLYIPFFEQNPNIKLMFKGNRKKREKRLGNMPMNIVRELDRRNIEFAAEQ
jgi:hemoglobin-like flavoprotein